MLTAISMGYAWTWEIDAARNLMAHAYRIQLASTDPSVDVDAVLTLLALGVEKTLKLALGCCHIRDTGEDWPQHLKKYRHRTDSAQRALLKKALKAAPNTAHAPEIEAAVRRIETDPIWEIMILALDMYGSKGRFHYQAVLAQDPDRTRLGGPRESWIAVAFAALIAKGTPEHNDALDEKSLALVTEEAAKSILMWWSNMAELALLGAFGEMGIELGKNLQPPS